VKASIINNNTKIFKGLDYVLVNIEESTILLQILIQGVYPV
jgi:hypothetical protein